MQPLSAPQPDSISEFSFSTALVVEDDNTSRYILSSFLKQHGIEIIHANNGRQAVEKFIEHSPDIVFMDINMPVMNGYDATRAIKKTSEDNFVPVIFVTELKEDVGLAKCVDAGGDDFICKPYDPILLKSKLIAMQRISKLYEEIRDLYRSVLRDQETARQVYTDILAHSNFPLKTAKINILPASTFGGDLFLSAAAPNKDVFLMLGDFTGHGLRATMGALPITDALHTLVKRGSTIKEVIAELNEKLCQLLPIQMFMTAQLVVVDSTLQQLSVFNCGMPDILIIDGQNGDIKHHFESVAMPLGIEDNIDFENKIKTISINNGDKILLVSDGLIDSQDAAGDFFGQENFERLILSGRKENYVSDIVLDGLDLFMKNAPKHDDISLIEIACTPQLFPKS